MVPTVRFDRAILYAMHVNGESAGMTGLGVRRAKAAFFSGCKSHPATIAPAGSNRSSHGGNEVAEASGVEGHIW